MEDILSAKPGQPNIKSANRQPMRSLRPQGHYIDSARSRIFGGDSTESQELSKPPTGPNPHAPQGPPPGRRGFGWWRRLRAWWGRLSRNKRFGIISLLLLVFAVAVIGVFYFTQPNSDSSIQIFKSKKPKVVVPTTVASPLTGLPVSPDLAKRPVTGIMIENSDFARPQSGLQEAGVVYEAIAEGGITRFLSLFQDATPQYIGPVRSLRPYYIDFAAPFQASIVHIGGSPDALSIVRSGSYRDLDQFFNSSYFTRINARPAPHNVYTSFEELDKLNQSKGYTSSKFTIWPRKADKKLAVPTAKTLDFTISSADYYAHYDYDAATNTYNRSEGGAAHLDLISASDKAGVQLHPKVVIALVMPYSIAADGQHSVYGDSGTGAAYIFQDGGVTIAQWNKAGTSGQISFTDVSGNAIKLNAGQSWLTLVDSPAKITYVP